MGKLGLIILIISLSIPSFCQEKQTRKEKRLAKRTAAYQEVSELVKSGEFIFIAERAFPQGYQPVDLTTHIAELTIRKDSAEAFLPFFGRAFVAGYGSNDGGIKFENEVEDYSIEFDDEKQQVRIKFKAKADNDTYTCSMDFSSNTSVTLNVISSNKAGISYNGRVEAIKKSK